MRASSAILSALLLAAVGVHAEPHPSAPPDLGWLTPPPTRLEREQRPRLAPEHFRAIQADGNFVAPRYLGSAETALLEAVKRGDVETARRLLKAGVHPNGRDYWQDSALLQAVEADHFELVTLLLEQGAEINVTGRGFTPLGLAVKNNNLPMVRLLLRAGADPDRKNDDGNTPLHSAVLMDYADIARALLAAKPDLGIFNREGLTPLAVAAVEGREDMAALLLDAGADIERGHKKGRSPFWLALERAQRPITILLVRRGALIAPLSPDAL